jgi:hypothetical protein
MDETETTLKPRLKGGCGRHAQCTRGRAPAETFSQRHRTVRAAQGRLIGISVSLYKSILYGASAWAHRALNSPKRRFPARAVSLTTCSRKGAHDEWVLEGFAVPTISTETENNKARL